MYLDMETMKAEAMRDERQGECVLKLSLSCPTRFTIRDYVITYEHDVIVSTSDVHESVLFVDVVLRA